MVRLAPALALLVPLSALACSNAVRSDRDDSVPVPRGATWAWSVPAQHEAAWPPDTSRHRRGPFGERQSPEQDDAIFSQHLHAAAEAVMSSRGYRHGDDSTTDLLLSLDLEYPAPPRMGPRYAGYAPAPYPGDWRDRRLVAELRERRTGNVAWRASTLLDVYDLERTSASDAQRIVGRLLKKLP